MNQDSPLCLDELETSQQSIEIVNEYQNPEYCQEDIMMLDMVEIPKRIDQMISFGV